MTARGTRYSSIPAAMVVDPDDLEELPASSLDDESDGWYECDGCGRQTRDGAICVCRHEVSLPATGAGACAAGFDWDAGPIR